MSEQAAMQQPSSDEEPQDTRQDRQGRAGGGGGGGERGGRRRRHSQHAQQQQGQQQRRPEPSINMDELRDLVQLIAQNGFTDFELEREGFRVRLRRELAPQVTHHTTSVQAAQPVTQPAAETTAPAETKAPATTLATKHPGAEAEASASEDEGLHIITSPIVGTFYRSPSPTSEQFVKIGSRVEPDAVVCIIEAMKLMNEIQAETTGEVVKIYVENGQPVEFGQPLFGIKQ